MQLIHGKMSFFLNSICQDTIGNKEVTKLLNLDKHYYISICFMISLDPIPQALNKKQS